MKTSAQIPAVSPRARPWRLRYLGFWMRILYPWSRYCLLPGFWRSVGLFGLKVVVIPLTAVDRAWYLLNGGGNDYTRKQMTDECGFDPTQRPPTKAR